jgi:hypothetical protein
MPYKTEAPNMPEKITWVISSISASADNLSLLFAWATISQIKPLTPSNPFFNISAKSGRWSSNSTEKVKKIQPPGISSEFFKYFSVTIQQ